MEHFQGVLFNEDGRIMPRGERASLGFQKEVTKTYWIRGKDMKAKIRLDELPGGTPVGVKTTGSQGGGASPAASTAPGNSEKQSSGAPQTCWVRNSEERPLTCVCPAPPPPHR